MGNHKVSFFGLCYVRVPDTDQVPRDVYLPSKHRHQTTIAIPVDDLNVQESDDPTAIIYEDDKQIACYSVAAPVGVSASVTFSVGGKANWDQSNRKKSIDFAVAHGNIPAKDSTQLNGVLNAVVDLNAGELECENTDNHMKLIDKPNKKERTGLPRSIEWKVDGDKLTIHIVETTKLDNAGNPVEKKTRDIKLKETGLLKSDRHVTITNVSNHKPDEGTLKEHFAVYYDLLTQTLDPTKQLELVEAHLATKKDANGEGNDDKEGRRSVEVYDCVPPGTGS